MEFSVGLFLCVKSKRYNLYMKFSVKSLLAITLLIALTVNGCNTLYQLTDLQIENSKLQSLLTLYRNQTVNFEERKLLFENAIDATILRTQDFERECQDNAEAFERYRLNSGGDP